MAMMMGDEPIPAEWTPNTGVTRRPLRRGMLIRMRRGRGSNGGELRLMAVNNATDSSATVVPVSVGGWNSQGGEVISPMSEVEYRRDEGAPYDSERYGGGAVIAVARVPVPEKLKRPAVVQTVQTVETTDNDSSNREAETIMAESEDTVTTKASKVSAPPVRASKASKTATRTRKSRAVKPAEDKVFRTGKKKTSTTETTAVKPRRVRKTAAPAQLTETEPVDQYPYSLNEAAEAAGVLPSRVNAYRRAGLLPKRGGWETRGRAVMYSQKAVDAVTRMQEKGVRIPAPTSAGATTIKSTKASGAKRGRRAKLIAAAAGAAGLDVSALVGMAEDAEAKAAQFSSLAERLRGLVAEIGG